MNILAIDCGSRCGFASLMNGRTESGVIEFALKRGESPGMRFILFNSWLHRILDLIKPDLVVYEMAHQRGGFATEILIGMVTRIQEECLKKEIEYTSIHSMTLKKFATGSGKANKEIMLEKAKEKFKEGIEDHNEADALWMLEYARKEI